MRSDQWCCFLVYCMCLSRHLEATTSTTTIVTTSSTTTTTTKTDSPSVATESPPQSCPSVAPETVLPSKPAHFQKQNEYLQMTAKPEVIFEGVTNVLSFNCTFQIMPAGNVAKLMMMGIFRIREQAPDIGKQEVVSVNPLSSPTMTVGNMTIARNIKPPGLSYIHLTIKNPSLRDTGTYRCSVLGVDNNKEPFVAHASINVSTYGANGTLSQPHQDTTSATKNSDRMMSDTPGSPSSKSLEAINRQLQNLQAASEELALRVTALEKFKQSVESRLSNIKDSVFQFELKSPNIHYYISRQEYSDAKIAQATCELFGGYLAEVDSLEEFKLLSQFTLSVFGNKGENRPTEGVLIGGTDEEVEGQWRSRFSALNMPYTAWGTNYPEKNSTNNCIVLWKHADWRMRDQPCRSAQSHVKFMCEVPERK